jgi:hypothetical protein
VTLRILRLGVLFVGLVACSKAQKSSPKPPAASAGAYGAASGKADTKAGDEPSPSSSAAVPSAPGNADLVPSSEVASEDKRAPAGKDTRGVVQCGDSSCKPGKEACVDMSGWKCVPSDAVPEPAEVRYFCDDGTDCPQGETCCLGFESAIENYVCTKRRGPETNCRMEICAEGGARCPKGQVCLEGTCKSAERRATCGDQGPCPKERPLCLWSGRAATCGTYEEYERAAKTQPALVALRCTRPSDCGPEARCGTNALWNSTRCLTNTDEANEGKVCASDADCSNAEASRSVETPRKGKCVSVRGMAGTPLPPWLNVCTYAE